MQSLPGPDAIRVGTAEREETVRVLGDHFAQGRLAVEEYEERVDTALRAGVRADLRQLVDDLPEPQPAFLLPPAPPAPPGPPAPRPAAEPALVSEKSRVVAGVLQLVLPFGTGRFYTGHIGIAVAQLLLVLVGVGVIWSMIDGVLLLVNGGTDAQGRQLEA
ncbi:DUF1707 SHOCT-like domain-containing protein [Amycolatopsis cihanbeyliensis]|uniref:TM2 domain-containing protein n=1 Tax=Amycolatopsis cihanbeyliensis TaxID=1128664 RepID=A0A542DEE9_AMYCI|nr:DUF1707 domain-containing protein [Amycolatopsis cihanbeyliensis]TQJ01454.1 TM2 domain-containing protein [Amycolatopsis cihanbeyliensis]